MTDGPEAVNRFVPVRPACYHRPMKPLPALICLALMAACAPPPLYHKAGADPALAEARRTQCEVAALREVPRDIRTTYVPPRYMPAPFFDAHGHRWHGFVLLEPGRTESYDANAALRARVVDQCMAEAGFRPVRLPACPPDIPAPAPGAAQPPLGPASCARRMPEGGWQIVTPG